MDQTPDYVYNILMSKSSSAQRDSEEMTRTEVKVFSNILFHIGSVFLSRVQLHFSPQVSSMSRGSSFSGLLMCQTHVENQYNELQQLLILQLSPCVHSHFLEFRKIMLCLHIKITIISSLGFTWFTCTDPAALQALTWLSVSETSHLKAVEAQTKQNKLKDSENNQYNCESTENCLHPPKKTQGQHPKTDVFMVGTTHKQDSIIYFLWFVWLQNE